MAVSGYQIGWWLVAGGQWLFVVQGAGFGLKIRLLTHKTTHRAASFHVGSTCQPGQLPHTSARHGTANKEPPTNH
jgi:hypothetical protein